MSDERVLDGVRVLDFTQVLAGATATRIMATMGAEVIKVELTPSGDLSRTLPVVRQGRSAYFMQHNRGKKSLCLNLQDPKALEIVKALIPKMDVMIENFSPGVIARRGLDWETVHALNPKLVMCSISAFGQSGPLSKFPGFDFIAQAYSGLTSLIGKPGEIPGLFGVGVGDVGTGMNALAAINAALFSAHRAGGVGRYIDISLLDTYFNMNDTAIEMISASHGEIVPQRSGSHHFALAPLGIFECRDGFVLVMVLTPEQWVATCQVMERPELADDPRFQDHASRVANLEQMIEIIESWMKSVGGVDQVLQRLQEFRIPVAPILSVDEAMAHPHVIQRGLVQTMDDPALGKFQVPGVPFLFGGDTVPQPLQAPYLGEHNAEVLGNHLSYTRRQIQELEAAGVLASDRI